MRTQRSASARVAASVLPIALSALAAVSISCSSAPQEEGSGRAYDIILRGGTIYDGTGSQPITGDVAIDGDRIAAIGDLSGATAATEVDVEGLAVAPGFINMLSWATESLIEDGRSQSDIRQGVTLECFGEGWSMGPFNDALKEYAKKDQGDIQYDIEWSTLAEYLDWLVEHGISTNVASFVGATTVRIHEVGYEDRPPTPDELTKMKALVRQAMEEGALGVGSSLIYAPAFYAKTDELIELCKVAAEYDGLYITHMRSEGNKLLEALDEVIEIARKAGIRAEIYHLKAAGASNWPKLDQVIEKIEAAQREGLGITADMYTYIAGATGLDAAMPPWVQEGGYDAWAERLEDPTIRSRVIEEMKTPTDEWENLYLAAGSPEKVILVGFKNDALKPLTGKTLGEVARERGKSPEETAIDLVIEDGSRVGTVYFLMSEENVQKQLRLPWVSFDSDAESVAPEGVFLKSNPHPRAYGNFARLLGKYVRDEKLIPLREAIRRLTSFPAENLRIKDRGKLAKGFYADVVVFDPDEIQDHATFEKPHQYSTGVVHVFVNGAPVLRDGEHTGAKPGRVVRGPGWRGGIETEATADSASSNSLAPASPREAKREKPPEAPRAPRGAPRSNAQASTAAAGRQPKSSRDLGPLAQYCSAPALLEGAWSTPSSGVPATGTVSESATLLARWRNIQEKPKSRQRKGPRFREREGDPWFSSVVLF